MHTRKLSKIKNSLNLSDTEKNALYEGLDYLIYIEPNLKEYRKDLYNIFQKLKK